MATENTIKNQILTDFEVAAEVISGIRNIRKQKNIANKEVLDFFVKTNVLSNTAFDTVIAKLGNLSSINYVDEKIEGAFSFLVKSNEYFIPLGTSIDVEAELDKLQKELDYTKGFKIGRRKVEKRTICKQCSRASCCWRA